VVNSNGVEAFDWHAHERASLQVRYEQSHRHKFSKRTIVDREPVDEANDLTGIARGAARRAARAEDASSLENEIQTVILEAPCAARIVEKLAPSFYGRSALQDRTQLAGEVGEPGLQRAAHDRGPPPRTHGHPPPADRRRGRSNPEHVPRGRRRPAGYLWDWASAREADEEPTGNGSAPFFGRHASVPSASLCNFWVEPGDVALEEMVEEASHAVLVRDGFMGDFTMDHTTGDFSFVAPMAFEVDGGQVRQPPKTTTVASDIFEALASIEHVGCEPARFTNGEFVPLTLGGVTCAT